jgi:hypothetical protein
MASEPEADLADSATIPQSGGSRRIPATSFSACSARAARASARPEIDH